MTLARFERWQDHSNVAETLSESVLGGIGERCVEEYEIDRNSRADWESVAREALKNVLQKSSKKSYPFENAANVKAPMLTAACLQFAARAYPAIVKGPNIVKFEVDEFQDEAQEARAKRVCKYMSKMLLYRMTEWSADIDTMLHQIPAVGCAFRKIYWSREDQRPKSELISALNLIVNQGASSIHTVPRISHFKTFYPHELDEKRRSGFFLGIDPDEPQPVGDRPDGRFEDDYDARDSLAPHQFIEQHRYLDLDDDGVREPWVVFVHLQSRRVYRLAPNYNLKRAVLRDGKIVRLPRYDHFVKYPFIPDPRGGFYDIGFGELLKSLEDTTNTAFNQMLDAGHLQNAGGGFIGSGLNLKKQEFRFTPGRYHVVNTPGQTIRDAMVTIDHPGPSAVMLQLISVLLEWGKSISSVQDVLTGDQVPANQPATTTLAQIEQGLTVFTAIYKRIYNGLTQEYKLLYELLCRYLDPEDYAKTLNLPTQGVENDFVEDETAIVPQADPQMVTDQQRLGKAQALADASAHPVIGPELKADVVARRFLQNISIDNYEELLRPHDDQQQSAQAQVQAQAAQSQIAMLQAKIAELTANAQLKGAQTQKIHSDMMVAGAGVQRDAQELASSEAHRAHEAALALRTSEEAAAMARVAHAAGRDDAAHDQLMARVAHHAGREDARAKHTVDLLGLAASDGPAGEASVEAGGAKMAPAVVNRVERATTGV
jgi:chaperonin GroES